MPFCGVSCDFCAFDKQEPKGDDFERFLDGLAREAAEWVDHWTAETVFWGGGTPGLLRARDLRSLGRITQGFLVPGTSPEWTVELTPYCATRAKLAALAEAGVTRISLGVQTFQPRLLRAIGRPYDPSTVFAAVDRIRETGDFILNLDLIIAIPGQTADELEADLDTALSLRPDHLSAYCLTLEDDTPLLFRLAREGHRPDEDFEADRFRQAWERLTADGFRHYEVSNFARPGRECIHNLNTWRMGDWLGLGPSAASQAGGRRFRNPHGLEPWLEGLAGRGPRHEEIEPLSPDERAKDRLVFGLRTDEGVEVRPFADHPALGAFLLSLEAEGLAENREGRLRLNLEGRLRADAVAREIYRLGSGLILAGRASS